MLQKKYNNPGNAIASYSYEEIASGLGYISFYAYNSTDSTSTKYGLITETSIKSYVKVSSGTVAMSGDTNQKLLDIDWDITMDDPRTLNGRCFIQIPFYAYVSSGNYTQYLIVKLRKYSGTTETDLGTVQSTNFNNVNNLTTATPPKMFVLDITNTPFKRGDILRLTLESYYNPGGGSGSLTQYVGNDPNARADATVTGLETTQLKLDVPFRIDI